MAIYRHMGSGQSIELPNWILEEPLTATRRSLLYVPLTKERCFAKALTTNTDAIIFDLEDSVPYDLKEAARANIRHIPESNIEYFLRINAVHTPLWEQDLHHYPTSFTGVIVTKVNKAEEISRVREKLPHNKLIFALIETLAGVRNVDSIAATMQPGEALLFGAGDLSTELGVPRVETYKSPVLQKAMADITLAAKYHSLHTIDTPYRQFHDEEGLKSELTLAKICGMNGKQAIHPKQIATINNAFVPTLNEVMQYASLLQQFAEQRDSHAVVHNNSYEGKPSLKLAANKLREYIQRGHLMKEAAR